jgi:hypothetical protein
MKLRKTLLLFVSVFVATACLRQADKEANYSTIDAFDQTLAEHSIKRFPYLDTEWFRVFIADNDGKGPHWAGGYNGISALIPHHSGINIFNPYFAGLNYETIDLGEAEGEPFEPRRNPMKISEISGDRVVLEQAETPASHVSAKITFRTEEPWYVHQTVELTFHQKFEDENGNCTFSSLFASYMHLPVDNHLYLRRDDSVENPLAGWIGVTKESHDFDEGYILAPLPDDSELTPEEHLELMNRSGNVIEAVDGPLPFYYGHLYDDLVFLLMFKQAENVELAYSPTGGFHGDRGDGSGQAWSPAWDYVLHLDHVEAGQTYRWDICLVVKPFAGRKDILEEVDRYMSEN